MITEGEFLYIQIAAKLEKNISQGILKTGDKLLSVRTLSKEQGISISTAFKAYTQLEIKGLIEARSKSGYYVRFRPRNHFPVNAARSFQKEPEHASVDEMIVIFWKNQAKNL